MSEVYDSPKYYDIAFSFRDIAAEVDVCEECIRRFSKIEVKSVFEIACGTSPYLEELAKRGYRYLGLDINEEMLAGGEQKAARLGIDAKLIQANLTDFTLDSRVDFAYILLGSLSVTNASEQEAHFNSVARVLKKGGLYLLDWCIQFEPPWQTAGSQTWVLAEEKTNVKTTVSWLLVSATNQTFKETITLEVDDDGRKLTLVGSEIKKAIYPQEFLCIIRNLKQFEFVGWWNNWNLSQPLEDVKEISRPIALVRRI